MERRSFIGNIIGLIGVVASANTIASIGVKNNVVLLPSNTCYGNILMRGSDGKVFYFTGKSLVSVIDNESIENISFDDNCKDFAIFSSAFKER